MTPAQIAKHYYSNLDQLSNYTYFHFLTRLWFLLEDKQAQSLLHQYYQDHLRDKDKKSQLEQLQENLTNPKNPTEPRRQLYLDKYPQLRPLARSAFAALFASKIWDLDLKDQLYSQWSNEDLQSVRQKLMNDHDAILTLSTYALNFIFLYEYFFAQANQPGASLRPAPNEVSPETVSVLYKIFADHWQDYLTTNQGLQSAGYFVTHVIINDALFYTRAIPESQRESHLYWLNRVSQTISQRGLSQVSLDCLFEILVCYKMLNEDWQAKSEIKDLASQSLSHDRKYIVETFDRQQNLSGSEHRNVLYIVAFTDTDHTNHKNLPR